MKTFFLKKKNDLMIGLYVAVYAFILTMEDISFPLSNGIYYRDGAIYQYIGHLLLNGKQPYADAFDHKGLLLYIINAIGCAISYQWGMWIIDYLFMIGILCFSIKIANKYLSMKMSLLVCTIVYLDFQYNYWIGNTPDYFALFFLIYAFYAVIILFDEYRFTYAFLAGVCTSCCFWLKQTTIAPIVFMCCLYLFNVVCKNKMSLAIKSAAFFLFGMFSLSILICSFFLFNGTWNDMIRDYFMFNFMYSTHEISINTCLSVLIQYFGRLSMQLVVVWSTIYVIIVIRKKRSVISNKTFLYSWICLIATVTVLIIPGNPYVQYYLICYPIFIVIISSSFDTVISEISELIKKSSTRISPFILRMVKCTLTLTILISIAMSTFYTCSSNWTRQEKYDEIIPIINQACKKNDTIAVGTPHDCGLYLETGHESATTYPYIQLMRYEDEEMRNDYNRQIGFALPRLIIWGEEWDIENFLNSTILEMYTSYFSTKDFDIYIIK